MAFHHPNLQQGGLWQDAPSFEARNLVRRFAGEHGVIQPGADHQIRRGDVVRVRVLEAGLVWVDRFAGSGGGV